MGFDDYDIYDIDLFEDAIYSLRINNVFKKGEFAYIGAIKLGMSACYACLYNEHCGTICFRTFY